MTKKAFTLFFVLILIFILSLLSIRVYEIKSLSSTNIANQYNYIQAKNHLEFLQEYVNSIDNLNLLEKVQIENDKFEIFALIEKIEEKKFMIELNVQSINYNIRVYKKVEIIK